MRMPYGRILPYLRPWMGRFITGVLIGVVAAAFNGVLIVAINIIFSLVLRGQTSTLGEPMDLPFWGKTSAAEMFGLNADAPVGLAGVLLACASIPIIWFMTGVLDYLNKYCLAWVGNKMLYQIRNDVFRSILRQSPAFFSTTKAGELMQTVFNQSRVAQANAVQLVQLLTNRPLTIITILAVLFAKDWFFTLMSLVIFPLCLGPVIAIGRRVRKSGAKEEQEVGAMMTAMHESFTGIRLVKAYAREDYEVRRFDRANASMSRNVMRWTRAMARLLALRRNSLVTPEALRMLEAGSTADPDAFAAVLGRRPLQAPAFFDGLPRGMMRRTAQLGWLVPLLRHAVAIMWVVTGVVSAFVFPVESSLDLLARTGLVGVPALLALYGAAALDVALGVGLWVTSRRRWIYRVQLALIVFYTVVITLCLSEYWAHPYGPVLKNLPLLAAIAVLHELDDGEGT